MGNNIRIEYCRFHNNWAPYGGAIYLYNPKRFVTCNSNYTGNVAIEGGAINFRMYNPTLLDFEVNIACNDSFFDNIAEKGGALYCSSITDTIDSYPTPQINKARFNNNTYSSNLNF